MGEVIPFPLRAAEPVSPPAPAMRPAVEPRADAGQASRSQSASRPAPGRQSVEPEPLLRAVLGDELRAARVDRGERIADVAQRAGMSPQYLSEIERGRKDPSSEMLAAVTGSLGLTVHELSRRIARRYDLAVATPRASSSTPPPAARPTEPLCLAA